MSYQVIVPRPVQKQLDNLPAGVRQRVIERILALKENPRPFGSIKLTNYADEYRIRVGNYRVRYQVNDQESIVILLHCAHRKDAYMRTDNGSFRQKSHLEPTTQCFH